MACNICGDRGRVFVNGLKTFIDCPKCGGIKKEVEVAIADETLDKLDWLRIPDLYKDTLYVRNKLVEEKAKRVYSSESVERTLNMMDTINSAIRDGEVISNKLYFSLRKMYDELAFIFGCQQLILKKGMTTAPLVSLNTLSDIIEGVYSSNFGNIREYYNVTLADYIECDYLFLIAGGKTNSQGWVALADIITERTRLGKPIFVFGYWQSSVVAKQSYTSILDGKSNTIDGLTVIEFEKGTSNYSNNKATNNDNNISRKRTDNYDMDLNFSDL